MVLSPELLKRMWCSLAKRRQNSKEKWFVLVVLFTRLHSADGGCIVCKICMIVYIYLYCIHIMLHIIYYMYIHVYQTGYSLV